MKRITQPSQLKLIKDFPSRMSMLHRIKNEKIEYKEHWRDNHWYLAPYWQKMSHISNTINRSHNVNLNQLTYKLKKIAGPIVPFSEILDHFVLPDRNGEYRNGYRTIDGWSGTTRSCNIERKVNPDLTIDIRVGTQRLDNKKEPKTCQEHYKFLSDKRKSYKECHSRKKISISNAHKKDIKVKGYTKQQRIDYMCKFNDHSMLVKRGLVAFQGPLRKRYYSDYTNYDFSYYWKRKKNPNENKSLIEYIY